MEAAPANHIPECEFEVDMMRNIIRARREAAHLTQAMLADISGISQGTLSEIESGRHLPRINIALKIAEALQCHPCQLFLWEEGEC